jgi:hypothetical protein
LFSLHVLRVADHKPAHLQSGIGSDCKTVPQGRKEISFCYVPCCNDGSSVCQSPPSPTPRPFSHVCGTATSPPPHPSLTPGARVHKTTQSELPIALSVFPFCFVQSLSALFLMKSAEITESLALFCSWDIHVESRVQTLNKAPRAA